jgi:hypothetical protein
MNGKQATGVPLVPPEEQPRTTTRTSLIVLVAVVFMMPVFIIPIEGFEAPFKT